MEKSNAETIKRALEEQVENYRNFEAQFKIELSIGKDIVNALALITSQEQRIKELEAETKRLESLCVSKDIIIGDLSKENERLRADCAKGANALIEEMQKNRTIEADTVQKFSDKVEKKICETVNAPTPSESYIVEKCIEAIYQIAKEMLEGE